jgi:hypothetical protein
MSGVKNNRALNTGKEGLRGSMNLKTEKSLKLQIYFKPKGTENETCKPGEASTSVSPTNRFKLNTNDEVV